MTTVPQAVVDLVERYCRNREMYRHSNYNETQVRVEFIDPLFVALGWDVHNTRGASPQYQDVVHEASVRIRGSVRSPDYAFRMGPKEVFYVEAKKPSVNIHEDTSPAYQLRRYAWTAKLPVSVLTDFEELSVYEGRRRRPKPDDSAATARVMYVTCDEYLDQWDQIAGVLSKEAVMRGDLDRFAEQASGKRGTQEVDAAFLAEIEQWRLLLARNLALRNPGLSTRELNYAVQKIIDRLIFLRIAEDRGIEPYEQLRGDAVGEGIYPRLMQRFQRADARYNSGLFHFAEERGRADDVDAVTPGLAVDDKTLRQIIDSLYYPVCPYEFSVLGADILGHVYEQFLGSVISLTAGHRAKVEEKPEVRKAGGVYYTPTYIVDYIVQQTVGQLVENKTPRQVERLRIVDPACGSGSFLLGAYQFLMDWHLTWYAERLATKNRPEIYMDEHGQPRLTIETKKRILTNNIYGVDIDGQAVEVTKLSLLLKVLEGENEASMGGQMTLFGGERALPDLSRNIQCGNSLIGSDYLEQAGLGEAFMDEEEMYRVNPFDWEVAFPEVFNAHGGFDAVIGNPPYLFGENLLPDVKQYYSSHMQVATNQYDSYWLFIERGLALLNGEGMLSLIVPDAVLARDEAASVRRLLLSRNLAAIYHCGQVFGKVGVSAAVFVAGNGRDTSSVDIYVPRDTSAVLLHKCDAMKFSENPHLRFTIYVSSQDYKVLEKINKQADPAGTFLRLSRGEELGKKHVLAQGPVPILVGSDVGRYRMAEPVRFIAAAKKRPALYEAPKLVMVKTGKSVVCTIETDGLVTMQSLYNMHAIQPETGLLYLLANLNSKIVDYYAGKVFTSYKKLFPQFNQTTVKQLPIRTIDFDHTADVARHDRVVALVERMLDLHKRLAAAHLPQEKSMLQRQIDATDRQIDKLVYELYDLTEEEIAIVEGES